MKFFLLGQKKPPIYSEEFVIKYWDKSGEFAKQKEFSVFFASKNRHQQAKKVCMLETGCKIQDIVSCTYQ